mmetsp:Transcript_5191/g.13027  ORF Transcript_5191/g.13027 Transcript_5191/m.13027 type:complete len:204 (+) Transcript_5191:379-990(+)
MSRWTCDCVDDRRSRGATASSSSSPSERSRPLQGPTRTSRSNRNDMLGVGSAAAASTSFVVVTGYMRPPKADSTPTTRSPMRTRPLDRSAEPPFFICATVGVPSTFFSVRPSGFCNSTSQRSLTLSRDRSSASATSSSSSERSIRRDTFWLPSCSRDRTAETTPAIDDLGHMASPSVADVATTRSPARQPAACAPPLSSTVLT